MVKKLLSFFFYLHVTKLTFDNKKKKKVNTTARHTLMHKEKC